MTYRECEGRKVTSSFQSVFGFGISLVEQASERLPLVQTQRVSNKHNTSPTQFQQEIYTVKTTNQQLNQKLYVKISS